MKLGYLCIASSIVSLVTTIWMLLNGTVFLHGFVIFASLFLFGLCLVRRGRRLNVIQRWAKNNPDEAIGWILASRGKGDE